MTFTPGNISFDLSIIQPQAGQQYVFNYTFYQGLLLEDGLDIKFYTTDNFQQYDVEQGQGFGKP